jgi:hypothetical protein
VSGTPMSLLRLPRVASTQDSGFGIPDLASTASRKIDASISLTVVLPLLPVSATSGIENFFLQ